MQRIPFATQTYALASLPASAQDLVNLYAEGVPAGGRSEVILKSTPGLAAEFTFGPGPIRAIDSTLPGRLYGVSGNQFVRRTQEQGIQSLGTVGTGRRPTIAVSPTAVVVCTPPDAYVATHDLNAVAHKITGTLAQPFPGASSVAYINGYWVFTADKLGSDQFFWSELLDADTYDGLAFASADSRPNVLKRGVFYRGELWLFGESGVEAWYNSGDAAAPFVRRSGGDIPFGCAFPATIAECDNSLFWLGTNGLIYRNKGYSAERISTFPIEEWIRSFGDATQTTALSYVDTGHAFYAITFKRASDGLARTWVYDVATGLWHRRASSAGGTGRWRADVSTLYAGAAVFGADDSATMFRLNTGNGSDDGFQLRRIACLPPIWADTRRAFMSRFELELDAGTQPFDPTVEVSWSDDGGRSYGAARALHTGDPGQYRRRSYATRLGSFRQRVMRIQCDDIMTLYAADADVQAGEH